MSSNNFLHPRKNYLQKISWVFILFYCVPKNNCASVTFVKNYVKTSMRPTWQCCWNRKWVRRRGCRKLQVTAFSFWKLAGFDRPGGDDGQQPQNMCSTVHTIRLHLVRLTSPLTFSKNFHQNNTLSGMVRRRSVGLPSASKRDLVVPRGRKRIRP